MTCPKCHGEMRTYERSGVTIDQCTECRGIFHDRGELERLVDADTRFQAGGPAAPAGAPALQEPAYQQQYAPQQSYGHQGYGQKPHKKRKSFFEELFD
jgi:Zn-finger nucleic acid-binding protein